jgi:hypothetical protein
MSIETFRGAVQAAIEQWQQDNYPNLPVQWDNSAPLDQSAVGTMWLDVRVRPDGGGNVGIGDRARALGRDRGTINTHLYVKVGEGTATADQIIESLRELLRNRRLGGGTLEFPVFSSLPDLLGWRQWGLRTPFRLDSA